MNDSSLTRMAAFAEQPGGGNPAGVWIGSELPSNEAMLGIAADVGYSETAFLVRQDGERWQIRYFSPEMEIPFCGHATIASGVVLGQRFGEGLYRLQTKIGEVPVQVGQDADGATVATLTSVEPSSRDLPPGMLAEALGCLGWSSDDFDLSIPPRIAFAGASHLVLALKERSVLADLDYDFERLKRLMLEHDLITLQLIWRQDATTFHARNPFPVGGVVEDPATGAAAAALGGYLRELDVVSVPADVVIRQGEDMGSPSVLYVHIPASGGIRVTGKGAAIEARG